MAAPAAAAAVGGDAEAPHASMSISDLNLDVLTHIAGFCSAQDVFALLRTSRALAGIAPADKRRLVRQALKTGLDAAFRSVFTARRQSKYQDREFQKHHDGCRKLKVEDIFPAGPELDAEGRPQVLVAGSITVRAALANWDEWACNDIDIFCTWDAAPLVRQRLVECRMICAGSSVGYGEQVLRSQSRYSGEMRPDIALLDHVESYAAWSTQASADCYRYRGPCGFDSYESPEAYFEEAVRFGEESVRHSEHVRADPKTTGWWYDPYRIGVPNGAAGGVFAYNYDLIGLETVQLIIAEEGVRDARQLLSSFDLEICKMSFDGNVFQIPSPQRSLCAQTVRLGARRDLVDKVVDEFYRGDADDDGDSDRRWRDDVRAVLAVDDATWAAVGIYPKQGHVDLPADFNFVMKLIERAQKYHRRGVEVLDATPGLVDIPTAYWGDNGLDS